MDIKRRKIEILRMMGYEVEEKQDIGYVEISLTLRNGSFRWSVPVNYMDLDRDFSVEGIVKKFNDRLRWGL